MGWLTSKALNARHLIKNLRDAMEASGFGAGARYCLLFRHSSPSSLAFHFRSAAVGCGLQFITPGLFPSLDGVRRRRDDRMGAAPILGCTQPLHERVIGGSFVGRALRC